MIQVKDLTFGYHRNKMNVLNDFSLTLAPGKVYGLLGKNGAGKSTLLYLICGLLTPKSGCVTYRDVDVRKRLPITLRDMFLVPEEFELPSVSLIDYIELNAPFYSKFSKEDMVKYLNLFEMDINIKKLDSLSMGQKKKVFMSFALATNTSLLLMDEPTNGLDIPGKSQFRKFIASGMSDDKTIVISTHQVRDIDKLLDHILIMDNQHVLLDASTYEVSKKFIFMESDNAVLLAKSVFSIPSLQGSLLMLPNEDDRESEINLELLFGAVTTSPNEFYAYYQSKNQNDDESK